jgi:integrase
MHMLTNAAVKAARPRAAAYKLSDGRGLHLFVSPTGLRSWRLRFRWQGREQLLTIGDALEVTLDQARDRADVARQQLARGEDPRRGVRAFEYVARQWHAHMVTRWTEVHAADVLASLERDVFPAIGAMPIGAITAPVILNVLHEIESRGSIVTAQRVRQRMSRVFRHAKGQQLVDRDPTADLDDLLSLAPPVEHHVALLEIEDARALLRAADQVRAGESVKLASRFLALTAVRLAAVRGACWSEIEGLDGPEPTWRVPAERMKLKAAKKLDAANDHIVPLSRQAAELLCGMHHNQIATDLIFPGRAAGRPIGEAAIGHLYDRAGFAGRHVPHGWRASFSTILNDRFPEHRAAIDKALGHAGDGKVEKEAGINRKVEAAYNRTTVRPAHIALRAQLFQAWADDLDG